MVDRNKERGDQDRQRFARSGVDPEGRTACGDGLPYLVPLLLDQT